MTHVNNRYLVEQKDLPNALFSRGEALLKTMMNDEGIAMKKIYEQACGKIGPRSCPYNRSAFSLNFREYINGSSSVFIVGIKMPEPERTLQCRAVYLCYGDRDENTLYITSELRDDGNYGLCARTRDNRRRAYSITEENEFDAVAKVYWDFTGGSRRKLIPQIIKEAKSKSA